MTAMDVLATISDVERDTGVPKETLRVWERRYAFPQPLRDAGGERLYPADQVAKLRVVKRLIDLGFRPGKIMNQAMEQLLVMADGSADPANSAPLARQDELDNFLSLIKSHRLLELRQRMAQALMLMGLQRFVAELVAPLTTMVGEAWASGHFAVFEEHLYTESLHVVMRGAIAAVPAQLGRPRILLTTMPQERHGLGLLMAEAMLALNGAECISLGVQTPIADMVEAARVQQADIIALSFSSAVNGRHAVDSVAQLRALLPDQVGIWLGGSCAMLNRRQLAPMQVLELDAIPAAIAQWRAQHAVGNAGI